MFLSENGSESETCFFQPENSSTKNLMLKSYNKIDLLSRIDKACLTLLPSPSYHRWQEVLPTSRFMDRTSGFSSSSLLARLLLALPWAPAVL